MSGRLLGPYRLLDPIGQGGMGVVYEAEDTRLGRRVAIKLLPAALAGDEQAVARLLREGRAAAALAHPRICSVLDVGEDSGQPYVVMERLCGKTLRRTLAAGPLPAGRVLEVGTQLAEALEAAHAKGIVHRDVKPSNVFLERDGSVKLTDFGVAKRLATTDEGVDREADTGTDWSAPRTRAGAAVGTVAYMSPEQARGEPVDARSDLFSLGAVLYEMATGRPPFAGTTDAVVYEGLLGRDPTPARELDPTLPVSLAAILEKALEKDRGLRYQSASDLRVDLLRAARAGASAREPGSREAPAASTWRRAHLPDAVARAATLLAAGLLATLALATWHWWRAAQRPLPRFTQLSFRRGVLTGARFTRDGHTIVYSALWDGGPPEIFTRRLDGPASTSLGLPPATLLSVSAAGELAILLAPAGERGVVWLGTLARVPLAGGAVRPLLEGVLDADWSPDARELAVIRWQDGQFQLEYPIGTVLLRPCPPTHVRVSPDGSRLALLDDQDGVLLLDRRASQRRLPVARWRQRLAWLPRGDALLVDAGDADLHRTLRRVAMDGTVSEVCTLPGTLVVHDVDREGRVLLHHGFERWDVRARAAGGAEEREASAFANSGVVGLSADGGRALLWYHGDGPPGAALLQPTSGGPPLRLGEGQAHALSADGRFALLEAGQPPRYSVVPTGTGEPRLLPEAPLAGFVAAWLLDERSLGFDAAAAGHPPRSWRLDLGSGAATALTPEGVRVIPGSLADGSWLARTGEGALVAVPRSGGASHALPVRLPADPFAETIRVSADGGGVFVREGSVPARLSRVDLASGRRTPWLELGPPSATGAGHVWSVQLTPDGRGYAYTHGLFLEDLFLVERLP